MATYTASSAKTVTTVANQIDTLTLTGTGKTLRVTGHSGTPHIFFTTAPLGQTPPTVSAGGDNCFVGEPDTGQDFPWNGSGIVISYISTGINVLSFMLF
jgi:hypothetical protein